MKILDSGERRKFDSGAVRDVAGGKGRCDLLPLELTGAILNRESPHQGHILFKIEEYVRTGNPHHLLDAIHSFSKNHYGDIYTAILEVAKQYEDGANKYDERNWEKGIPLHCYIDSGTRHYIKFLRGDDDEPHDRAFLWNMLGAIWTHKHLPEMIDLPFKEGGKE